MRKTSTIISRSFLSGKACREPNISTDGRVVYSYAAPIGVRDGDKFLILQAREHSLTTSRHCNDLSTACSLEYGYDSVERVNRFKLSEVILEKGY